MSAGPWEQYQNPIDTSFGGVEQQMPSAADIQVASTSSAGMNPKYMAGDMRSPQQVLAQYTPTPQQALPDESAIRPDKKGTDGPWSHFSPTPDQASGPWDQFKASPPPAAVDTQGPWNTFTPSATPSAEAGMGQVPTPSRTGFEKFTNSMAPEALNQFTDNAVGVIKSAIHSTVDAFRNNADEASQGLAYNTAVGLAGYGAAMAKLYSGLATGDAALKSPEQNLAEFNETSNSINKWMQDTFPNLKTKGKSFEESAALLGVPQGIAHAANEAAGGGNLGSAIELIAMVALAKPELKAKAKPGALPKLTPDQQAVFTDALKKSVQERAVTSPELGAQMGLDFGEGKAPMLENQTALEAQAKAAPVPDEMGRVEPTLTEAPKTAPEPVETPAPTETPKPVEKAPEGPVGELPPVTEGTVRMTHETDPANIPSIRENGLRVGEADHAGNPASVYVSEKPFTGSTSKAQVIVDIPKERMGANGTVLGGDVGPEHIVAIKEPWHEMASAIEKDPALIKQAVDGGFDHLGPEDKPAIDYIKQKYGRSVGVGKRQVVYHGTDKAFEEFGTPEDVASYRKMGLPMDGTFFFTDSPKLGSEYAGTGIGANVRPSFLDLKNPLEVDAAGGHSADNIGDHTLLGRKSIVHEAIGKAVDGGHDGVIIKNLRDPQVRGGDETPGTIYIAFRRDQIESAIGKKINKGTFGQSGAVKIFSFNDKPKQVADYEKAKAVVGRTDMPAEDFMAKHPIPTEDVRSRVGMGTGSFRTNNELKSNINNPNHAIHTLAYLDDTMHLLKEKFERKILENVYPHTSVFLKYFKDNNYADLKASTPIAMWFERNPGEWFDGKNYSPTLKQLTDRGMSPGAAAAWDHLYKGWEATWPELLDFAKSKGIDEPTRLPGYLPHFTQGAWRVRLFKDTPTGPEFLGTIGARSAKEAARLQEAANKLIDPSNPDHAGLKTKIELPQTHSDLAGMISGIFEAKDQVGQNKGLSQLLNKIYEQASIGNLKQSLERQETPQILHQMDRIVADKDFQLSPGQASEAVVKMTKIMEGIPAMKMRADFVTKTLFPLESKGYFEGVPKMRTAAEEYMKQFLHIPDNASGHIDGFIKDLFASHGLSPEIPMNILRETTGWISKFYLFYSPKYWAQNILQKHLFMGAAWTAKADLLTFGIKEGSVTKAIMDDLMSTSRGTKLESGESLHDYMEKTGHATPTFVENMDTSKFMQDPIAKGVERITRQGGARLGYTLFRQVFNEKDALAAAGRMTDAMNVPYDSEMGRPFFFAKEGQVGRPFAMFMQYPAHYLQFIHSQIRTLISASKVSPEATAYAVGGLAYTAAAMIAAGGLAGLPYMINYNAAIESINKAFGLTWPTTTRWAREIGKFMQTHNFNDEFTNMVAKTAEYGAVSGMTGYNISGSLQGPSFQAPQVAAHALGVFGAATVLALRKMSGEPVPTKDWGELLPDLPSVVGLKGAVEHYLRGDNVSSIIDKLKGNTTEMSPDRQNITLPGDYQRTRMDVLMNFLNMKSTAETYDTNSRRLNQEENNADKINAARLVESWVENPNDPKANTWIDKLVEIQKRGNINIDTLGADLEKYQQEKSLTGPEREAVSAGANTEATLRWERLRHMLEHGTSE